ncbi:MAG: TadE/TadG family type IV pilus assembly protein [Allosphingosinicella sp.]|uniref:TadE/TadG family type IV pilus assembly protein n=1 Tax=Allosphingosinicella sp. TaxID=2823234 RepID=UPI00394ECD92
MRIGAARLRALGGDERGVSVVELGLCLPVLAIILTGMLDLSMFLSSKMRAEQAAFRAIEIFQVAATPPDDAVMKDQAAKAAGVEPSAITITRALHCDGKAKAASVTVCPANETMERYLTVQVTATHSPAFPARFAKLFANVKPDGTIAVTGEATVRTQ